jgi:hypothetical protein
MQSIIILITILNVFLLINHQSYAYYLNENKILHSPYEKSKFNTVIHLPNFLFRNNAYYSMQSALRKGSNLPIILDSPDLSFKKDIVEYVAFSNRMPYIETNYEDLINHVPHLRFSNSMIYVPDFIIKHGRIFNEYEKMFFKSLNTNSNILFFGTSNLKNIVFKDEEIIDLYKIIEIPKVHRKDIIFHIFDIIEINQYDKYLFTLPWSEIEVEKLNFEMINILLYELDSIKKEFSKASITKKLISSLLDSMTFK